MDPTTRPRPPASPYALAPQASLVPGASPAPSQDSTSRRSVPNQKHKLTDQELYNDWRRAQEKELRDRLARKQDVRRRNRAQGQTVRPRPSPPPQAPAMSRRPSSTASLNRHMADTSMRDRPPRAGGRSRRGGRTGPMNPEGKAHAAWVRQTGATCRSCRRRKVKCGGNPQCERPDISVDQFERNYQAALTDQAQQSPGLPPPTPVPPQQPQDQFEFAAPMALLVFGTGPQSLPAQQGPAAEGVPQLRDRGDYPDPERLLDGVVGDLGRIGEALSHPSLGPLGRPSARGLSPGLGLPGAPVPAGGRVRLRRTSSASQHPYPRSLGGPTASRSPSSESGNTDILIARELSEFGLEGDWGIWECGSDGCGQSTVNLDDAKTHYGTAHSPFQTYVPPIVPFTWRCRGCDAVHPSPKPDACPCGGNSLQQQYHGYIAGGSVLHQDIKVRLTHLDDVGAAVNPTYPGQPMSYNGETGGSSFPKNTGTGGGPRSFSGQAFGLDDRIEVDGLAPPVDDTTGPDGADEGAASAIAALAALDALDAVVLYAFGFPRPVVVPDVVSWLFLLIIYILILTILAAYESANRLPRLSTDRRVSAELADASYPAAPSASSPRSCIFRPGPSQPSQGEACCRSERQPRMYETLLERAMQIRTLQYRPRNSAHNETR